MMIAVNAMRLDDDSWGSSVHTEEQEWHDDSMPGLGSQQIDVAIALHDIESGLVAVQPGCFPPKASITRPATTTPTCGKSATAAQATLPSGSRRAASLCIARRCATAACGTTDRPTASCCICTFARRRVIGNFNLPGRRTAMVDGARSKVSTGSGLRSGCTRRWGGRRSCSAYRNVVIFLNSYSLVRPSALRYSGATVRLDHSICSCFKN